MKRTAIIAAAAFALLGICLTAAIAYWTDGGTQISFSDYNETDPRLVDAGGGSTIIAWIDQQYENYQYFYFARVQRLDRRGDTRWAYNGIKISQGIDNVGEIEAVSDGTGGAIVAWAQSVGGDSDIYIQRISHDGVAQWTGAPVPVAVSAFPEYEISLCEDGRGGAFITWRDDRTGTSEIYLQRFDSGGNACIHPAANNISTTAGVKSGAVVALAGTGKAVVIWIDYRNGNADLYAQAMDTTGVRLWTVDQPVCIDPSAPYAHSLVTDNIGGAIAVWTDARNGSSDVFARRMVPGYPLYWDVDGLEICVHIGSTSSPKAAGDGAGGAYFTWIDGRSSDLDLYAQKVDFRGNLLWAVNGIPVCAVDRQVTSPMILPDGAGGAVITWIDSRYIAADIFAQRIDSDGTAQWTADGEQVCPSVLDAQRGDLWVANDGDRGVFIAWQEESPLDSVHISAYCFGLDGEPCTPEPRILGAGDLPGDEGGWVRLHIEASPYDDPEAFYDIVTGYNVWRMITPGASSLSGGDASPAAFSPADIDGLREMITDPERSAGIRLTTEQAAAFELPPGEWESLGFYGAMMFEDYYFTVPTRTDSSGSGPAYEDYVVTAHTTNHLVVHVSGAVQAYSVDNLAPAAPMSLGGEQSFSPEGLQLDWGDNDEADLAGYRVYRGTSSDFIPSPANLVGAPAGSELFDSDWTWDAGYWYKVAAVDRHDNESPLAVLGPEMLTGDDPMPIPDATFLAQNFPNPFNPSTTIAFGLKSGGFVNLSIYDAAGRLIAVLINESRPAGQYTTAWNGKDRSGTSVASGVYFYKLNVGEFEETKKMILLR
jgi:hypothetical protein